MDMEFRQSRSIKIRPSILRKAHHRAIESQKRIGEWIEEAIEGKLKREEEVKIGEGAIKLKTRVFELCNEKYPGGVGLAKEMGISYDTIYRVRKGERGIHERFIIGAMKAFPGHKLEDLFYVSED